MPLSDDVTKLREERLERLGHAVPDAFQGVTKRRIVDVLRRLHLAESQDVVDAVFALLDDETDSWFSKAPAGAHISDGATTAHVACHVGILQRGNTRLDREGRDYWIKPTHEGHGRARFLNPFLTSSERTVAGGCGRILAVRGSRQLAGSSWQSDWLGQFQIPAVGVGHSHLLRGSTICFENTWRGNQNADAFRARSRDIEAVQAVEKLHPPWRVSMA